ncbi:hypothetical protein Golob_005367 [Gossypium lobatum]|uniref:Uncharacterized protein n=1 Tax=Gossypium lobatum TaxID=34289 RepID=A0A7J8MT17_9ROSI|nr:hypothetical protein [Gossypium lobatum]
MCLKPRALILALAFAAEKYDIQHCDWWAGQDLLAIMLLHEKAVEALNPLAREFKSMGTMKKELTELQRELAQAHIQYLPYLCCILTVAFEHLSLVKFLTPSSGLQGYWNHYPIDMEFRPQHIFTRFMYAITFINKENKTII